MDETKRIQRKRTKGWRMPKGAIYVGRPSQWGNPFTGEQAVLCFEIYLRVWKRQDYFSCENYLAPLRGHDLACWCPLDKPCHADVLLRLANE